MRVCHSVAMRACSSCMLRWPFLAASAAGRVRPAGGRCRARRRGCSCAALRSGGPSARARSAHRWKKVLDVSAPARRRRPACPARSRRCPACGARAGQQVGAAAAVVVLVFGDIGQVRKIRKGAHDRNGLVARQLRAACASSSLPASASASRRKRTAVWRMVSTTSKTCVAFLVAQHVAEQAAEQADVFFQRRVLVERQLDTSGQQQGCSYRPQVSVGARAVWPRFCKRRRMIKFVILCMERLPAPAGLAQ